MTDIHVLRTQEYSTNLELLSQQMTPKLAMYSMQESGSGKAFRMTSQVDKTSAVRATTSAQPAINIDMVHDGRWVYPAKYFWGKVVDEIDLLQTKIAPQGAYTRSALAALNRQSDDSFLTAFFGDAKTGEDGTTTTSFASGNQIAYNVGTGTGMNIEKIRKVHQGLLDNDVDLDMEEVYIGVSPRQWYDLTGLTTVTSRDFSDGRTVNTAKLPDLFGMSFVISTRLPTDASGYRRCPVWVPSGMGRATWKSLSGVVRKRPDLQDNPDYVEASQMEGFARLDEDKCFEIKCEEA